MSLQYRIVCLMLGAAGACTQASNDQNQAAVSAETTTKAAADQPTSQPAANAGNSAQQPVSGAGDPARPPNELGRVMILEYHLIGDQDARWERQRDRFRKDLELLYERGYRPVSVSELVDKKIDLPRGLSPVVFTFDDASPSQFRYIERDGQLEIDPGSAVGVWLDFAKQHPDWRNKAVFCMLSGAAAGRSFFGDKGIEGQKTVWRHRKVKFLADQGFELCNHTLWHAQLSKYSDAVVQEQIARLQMAVDSAVPGYKIRTLALPLGVWPTNRELAYRGSWTDPRSKRTITYNYDAVLEVSGGPNRSPHDPQFDPKSLDRVQVMSNELEKAIAYLDKTGTRYVSDGDPRVVTRRPEQPGTNAGAPSTDSASPRSRTKGRNPTS